ncbi:hypothetical protein JZ751_019383 [Albula glossodonta]|uniref:Uncharacterized protein n=1 Tax=Albula glossodonta TaxID=121402 RepID=A0A8T2NQB8_9TELE|nr:hypothetical protein JZ751_019383 [Albula glossodonta]
MSKCMSSSWGRDRERSGLNPVSISRETSAIIPPRRTRRLSRSSSGSCRAPDLRVSSARRGRSWSGKNMLIPHP